MDYLQRHAQLQEDTQRNPSQSHGLGQDVFQRTSSGAASYAALRAGAFLKRAPLPWNLGKTSFPAIQFKARIKGPPWWTTWLERPSCDSRPHDCRLFLLPALLLQCTCHFLLDHPLPLLFHSSTVTISPHDRPDPRLFADEPSSKPDL
jgi:hypothetical protein